MVPVRDGQFGALLGAINVPWNLMALPSICFVVQPDRLRRALYKADPGPCVLTVDLTMERWRFRGHDEPTLNAGGTSIDTLRRIRGFRELA